LNPIGHIEGCFPEKFGTPRQPGLAPAATAALVLIPPFDDPDAVRGLRECSHVWLIFGFHHHQGQGWAPTVRPPRLGGNRRLGVFATRSPFRPNGLGLSAVRLEGLIDEPGRRGLWLSGHDLVDETPVYDIKPYIPYSDAIAGARAPVGFDGPPQRVAVALSAEAEASLDRVPAAVRQLILETLALDPRPAYRQAETGRSHGMSVAGYSVQWRGVRGGIHVDCVTALGEPGVPRRR